MIKSPLPSVLLALGVIAMSGSVYAQDAKKGVPAKEAEQSLADLESNLASGALAFSNGGSGSGGGGGADYFG